MDILTSKVALSNAVSGAAADAFSTLCLFPLDAIKLHMQADGKVSLKQVLDRVFSQGLGGVYHGVGSKILSGTQQKFQYFYVYNLLKELYTRRMGKKPSVLLDLVLGYISAFQGLGTTLPLEVTNTRLITMKSKHTETKGFMEIFFEQLQTEGIGSFYKTIGASAVLCINPAITYVLFESFKTRLLESKKVASATLTTLEALALGVVSKSIATIVTFPFIRAKVLMNVWKKKHEHEALAAGKSVNLDELPPVPGLIKTLEYIVEHEGPRGLYVGLEPQLFKGVNNAALMLAAKERIYSVVKGAILGNEASS